MALDIAKKVAVQRGLTAKFDVAYRAGSPLYPLITTMVPSSGEDESYGWIGDMPGMREWLGDRVFNELRAGTYTLANKNWESSLKVDRFKMDDDRVGLYGPLMQQLGMEAAYHPDELLVALMALAESENGWDGTTFFSASHVWGDSGTQSNDLSADPAAGSGGAIVAADFKNAYNTCRRALATYKNDQGKLLNRMLQGRQSNLCVLIPPDLDQVAYDALTTQSYMLTANLGGDNVVIDAPRIEVVNGLTNARKFYVINMAAPLKPFIFQMRERLRREMNGANTIEHKDIKFMTEARYNMGYGLWWTATLFTFT